MERTEPNAGSREGSALTSSPASPISPMARDNTSEAVASPSAARRSASPAASTSSVSVVMADETERSASPIAAAAAVGTMRPLKKYHYQPDGGEEGLMVVRTLPELMKEARARKLARLRTMRNATGTVLQHEESARSLIEGQFTAGLASTVAPLFDTSFTVARDATLDRLQADIRILVSNAGAAETLQGSGRQQWEESSLEMLRVMGTSLLMRSELLVQESEEWTVISLRGEKQKNLMDRSASLVTNFFRRFIHRRQLRKTLDEQKYLIQALDLVTILTELHSRRKIRHMFRARRQLLRAGIDGLREEYQTEWHNGRLKIATEMYCDRYQEIQHVECYRDFLDFSVRQLVDVEVPTVLEQQLPQEELRERMNLMVACFEHCWNIRYEADQHDLYVRAIVAQEGLIREDLVTQGLTGFNLGHYLSLIKILPWWVGRARRALRNKKYTKHESVELRQYSANSIQKVWRGRQAKIRVSKLSLEIRESLERHTQVELPFLLQTESLQRCRLEEMVLEEMMALVRSQLLVSSWAQEQEEMERQFLESSALEPQLLKRQHPSEGEGAFENSKEQESAAMNEMVVVDLPTMAAVTKLHVFLRPIIEGARVRQTLAPNLACLLAFHRGVEMLEAQSESEGHELLGRAALEAAAHSDMMFSATVFVDQWQLVAQHGTTLVSSVLLPECEALEEATRTQVEESTLITLDAVLTATRDIVRVCHGGSTRRALGQRHGLAAQERQARMIVSQQQLFDLFEEVLLKDLLDQHLELGYQASRQLRTSLQVNYTKKIDVEVLQEEESTRSDIDAAASRWWDLTLLESHAVVTMLSRLAQDAKEEENRMTLRLEAKRLAAQHKNDRFEMETAQEEGRHLEIQGESLDRMQLWMEFRSILEGMVQVEVAKAASPPRQKKGRPPPLVAVVMEESEPRPSSSPTGSGPPPSDVVTPTPQSRLQAHKLKQQQNKRQEIEAEEEEARQVVLKSVDYSDIIASYKAMKRHFKAQEIRFLSALREVEAEETEARESVVQLESCDPKLQLIILTADTLAEMANTSSDDDSDEGVEGSPSEAKEDIPEGPTDDEGLLSINESEHPTRRDSTTSKSSGPLIPLSSELKPEANEDTPEGPRLLKVDMLPQGKKKKPTTDMLELLAKEETARADILGSVEPSASWQQIILFYGFIERSLFCDEEEEEDEVVVVEEEEEVVSQPFASPPLTPRTNQTETQEGEEEEEEEEDESDVDSMASVGSVLWV